MKLLVRYNRLNIVAASLIFLLGSVVFYFLIQYILIDQIDETLRSEYQEIVDYTHLHQQLPEVIQTDDQHTYYRWANNEMPLRYLTVHAAKGSKYDMRQIQFSVVAKGKHYQVIVEKPLEGMHALLQAIILVVICMIALVLLLSYVINRVVIGRLWQPFYQTISEIKDYRLQEHLALDLGRANTDEFDLLNDTLNTMTGRIAQDYALLKGFTAQAAHEMQTPLAVMRAKVDLLMQNEELLKINGQQVAELEQSINRLARLNQSLLLLTKVENRQYVLNEQVPLKEIIEKRLAECQDIITAKNIQIHTQLTDVTVTFHTQLAEILVGNLLQNAVRYNRKDGTLNIELTQKHLKVINTSAMPRLDEQRLFKRFYRQQSGGEGNGLGLSIVKEICELAGYEIAYDHYGEAHVFVVCF